MRFFSIRLVSFYATLFCISLLVGSSVLQSQGLQPCPLCVLQRGIVVLLGISFVAGTLFVPTPLPRRCFYTVVLAIALAGMGVAGRHIFLQRTVDTSNPASCGADLGGMIDIMPFSQAIHLAFDGAGECTEVKWDFVGLTLPEWNAMSFAILGVVALIQILRKERY